MTYVFAGYLALGLAISDYPNMVVRGLFVAWTSLVLWNALGYYLAVNGQRVHEDLVHRLPVLLLAWGLLETVFWWVTTDRFQYGYMGNYIGYFLQPNLLARVLSLGFIVLFFKMRDGGLKCT